MVEEKRFIGGDHTNQAVEAILGIIFPEHPAEQLPFIGGDDTNQAVEARLDIIFNEYPRMEPMYKAMKVMSATPAQWIETAYDIQMIGNEGQFEHLAKSDPDFITKYKFMWATAIVDNPNIAPDLKNQQLELIFPDDSA